MRSVVWAVRRLLALAVAGRSVPRACALLLLGVALCSVAVPAAGEGVLRAGGVAVSAEKRVELAADPQVMRWRVAGMDSDAVFGAVAGGGTADDEPVRGCRGAGAGAERQDVGGRLAVPCRGAGGRRALHAVSARHGHRARGVPLGDGVLLLEVAGDWERACDATGRVEAAWLRQRRLGGWASRLYPCPGRAAADYAADVGDQRTRRGAFEPPSGTAGQWCGCGRLSRKQTH